MKELKTFDFLWKLCLIVGFVCIAFEVFLGGELNATWPIIMISNIYMCAYYIVKALDKPNNNT